MPSDLRGWVKIRTQSSQRNAKDAKICFVGRPFLCQRSGVGNYFFEIAVGGVKLTPTPVRSQEPSPLGENSPAVRPSFKRLPEKAPA